MKQFLILISPKSGEGVGAIVPLSPDSDGSGLLKGPFWPFSHSSPKMHLFFSWFYLDSTYVVCSKIYM